ASVADARAADLRYPVVVKPRNSHEMLPGGQVRSTGAPVYLRSREELLSAWPNLERRCRSAIAQAFVEGTGAGYFGFVRHGAVTVRVSNSIALAGYACVHFPALVVCRAQNGDIEPVLSYRLGVRCRWLLGDARHLFETLRGAPAGFPGRFPKRFPTLASMLIP